MASTTVKIDIPGVGTVVADNAASEATLQEILKAIQGGAGGGYKKGGKPTDQKNNELKDDGGGGGDKQGGGASASAKFGNALGAAIRPLQMVTGGFMALGKETTSLIQGFANAGDSLQGAASVFSGIPVLGGILSAVAGAADKALGSYQAATASGATFGNSMNNFAAAASGAGLTMEKFGAVIARNGDAMMMLGGTTEEGAKRFADMSKSLRTSQLGSQLAGLGYNTEQINQGMASYVKTIGSSGALQGKSTKELAAGAGAYLKEMDALAKITGRNRAELEAEAEARAKDAQWIAMTQGMDKDQRAMMESFVSSFPKSQQAAIKDMLTTGNITSEAAVKFNAMMGGTAQEVMAMGQAINSGRKLTQAEIDKTKNNSIAEAQSKRASAEFKTMGQYVGEMGETVVGINELANQEIGGRQKALSAQEKAEKSQAAALEQAKQNIAAVSNSFQMVLANSGLLNLLMKGFEFAANLVMQYIVPAFQIFSAVITEVGGAIIDFLKPAFEWLGGFINDTLYPAFITMAGYIMADIVPIFQWLGQTIRDDVWPALQSIASTIGEYVQPVFEAVGGFIADNLTPILLGLGTALVGYGVYLAAATVAGWIQAAASAAATLGIGGLAAAAWAAAAPILAIVAPIVALIAIFKILYDKGWTFGSAIEAVKDNLSRLWLTLQDWMDGLLVMIPNALGGISEEEAKKRQEIRDEARKELDDREKNRDAQREATAKERSSDAKDQKRKEESAKVEQKIVDLKKAGASGTADANKKEQEARDKKTELVKNYDDSLSLLLPEAQQQKSAFIKNPEASGVAGAEGTKKAIEAEAQQKAQAEAVAKQKEEEKAKTKEGVKGPANEGTTQESPSTLLASLNTKMDQLIKINKGSFDVHEKQLNVQRSFSNDLYESAIV